LLATFLNEPYWPVYNRTPWDEDRVGMNVIKKWNPWADGGPIVFHSKWWLREHWGRAFEVLHLEPTDPEEPGGQGAVLLRPLALRLTRAELDTPGDDPRELKALQRNIEQLHAEAAELYERISLASVSQDHFAQLERELERLQAQLDTIGRSHSWRLTRPLRAVGSALRTALRTAKD